MSNYLASRGTTVKIATFSIAISALALAAFEVSAAPVLRIQPGSTVTSLGSPVLLNLNVSDIADLFAYQFDIAFTPGILDAGAVTEGPFLSSVGSTLFLSGTIDNTAGLVTSVANTLIGSVPGATGDGTLVHLTFDAAAGGTATVTLKNVLLLNSALEPIESEVEPANVTVSASVVPEPDTFVLCGAGLAAAVLHLLHARSRRNAA
jgi:hypothetical protein